MNGTTGAGRRETRLHIFKDCTHWRKEQKELWEAVDKATKGAKKRRDIRVQDLFSDVRAAPAILKFLVETDVGRKAGEGEDDLRRQEEADLWGWDPGGEGAAERAARGQVFYF